MMILKDIDACLPDRDLEGYKYGSARYAKLSLELLSRRYSLELVDKVLGTVVPATGVKLYKALAMRVPRTEACTERALRFH